MKNLKQRITTTILSLAFTLAATAIAAMAANPPQVTMLTPMTAGLKTPVRVITDQAGYIYVADPRAGGVVKLAQDGFPALPATLIRTDLPPTGIALTARGDLLVTQGSYVQVFTFNPATNGSITAFSYSRGPRFGAFQMANGLAVAADGTIFVSDSLAHKVYRFNGQYAELGSFGSQGSADGQFNLPTALAYEKVSNQLAVVDTINGRVQFFTTAGLFVKKIGARGADPNTSDDATDPSVFFTAPQGIAFEYSRTTPAQLNRMYVTDSYQSRVQVIDPTGPGQRLRYIGNYGTPLGGLTYPAINAAQFKLIHPADVTFDPLNSRILVANGFGNLVTFGIDGGTSPTPSTTTKPRVTFTPPPTIVRTNGFTLSGTVDQPAVITVSPDGLGGAPACDAVFSDVTSWSCAVSGLQESQLYNFVLTATPLSTNGAQFKTTSTFPVVFNQAAPAFALSPFTSPTTASQLTVGGTTSATSISILNKDTSVSYPATISGQSWSATIALPAVQNNFEIYLNNDPGPTQNFTVERIVLVPSLLGAPSSTNVTSAIQNISGSINGVNEVTITLNSATTPVTVPVVNGIFSTALNLQNGANTIVIAARDASGASITPPPTFTYNFDPAKPAVAIDGLTIGAAPGTPLQDGGSITSGAQLTLAGTTTATAAVAIVVDNGTPVAVTNTAGTWTTTVDTTAFPAGLHTFVVTIDDNGFTSAVKRSIVIVPSAAPRVSLKAADDPTAPVTIYQADALTGLDTVHLSGIAANAVAVGVTLNGANLPVAFDATTGTYVVSIPVTFAGEGPQTMVATAYAADGAIATVTRTLVFSQTPPQVVGAINTLPSGDQQISVGSGIAAAFYFATPGDPATKTGIMSDCQAATGPVTCQTVNGVTTFTVPPTILGTLTFVDNAGNTSRNGRIAGGTGEPTVQDAIRALLISVHGVAATTENQLRGDVAPFTNRLPLPDGRFKYDSTPDGKIDIDDVRAILYRAVGLVTW